MQLIVNGVMGANVTFLFHEMSRKTTIFGSNGDLFEYDRSSSIIFVGGVAKSGLGLAVDIIKNFPVCFYTNNFPIEGHPIMMFMQLSLLKTEYY